MSVSEIISKYLNGASISSLAREYNVSTYIIRKRLTDNNIAIRSRNEQNKYSPQNQRKYTIKEDFFSVQTHDSVYLLGFLAADGSVQRDNTIKISLSAVDREFLEMVQKVLKTTYPIKGYENKDGYQVSTFEFRSETIREELAKYNIVNNKTYTFTFPKNIKEEFLIDFIRGYFDGDGSIHLASGYPRSSICAYNKEVLEEIVNILYEKYNIPKVNIQIKKGTHTYYFQYSINSTKKLYELFYKEMPTLYLPRKYKKFKEIFGEINSHEPTPS